MFIAPFVPSPTPVVEYMLKLADLKAGEVLFDMGSGDGRTVIMAAKTFGARGVGIEMREDLAKKAMCSIHEQNLDDRITIMNDRQLARRRPRLAQRCQARVRLRTRHGTA